MKARVMRTNIAEQHCVVEEVTLITISGVTDSMTELVKQRPRRKKVAWPVDGLDSRPRDATLQNLRHQDPYQPVVTRHALVAGEFSERVVLQLSVSKQQRVELLIGVKHYFAEINSSRHVLPYVSQSEVSKSPQVTDVDSMRLIEDELDIDIWMIATAAYGPVIFAMSGKIEFPRSR